MVNLVPRSFFEWPRLPSLWDEDEDFWSLSSSPSGLQVSEDDKHVYIEAQVPGVDPDKVDVTYEKGVLWIRGAQDKEEKGQKYYRRAASQFSYRVAVPGDVDETKEPEAVCKNGVMKVIFNKRPEVQPKKIAVKKE